MSYSRLPWPNDPNASTWRAKCHGNARHRHGVTDKRLMQRFKQQSKLKAATRFDSDFAHAYARQAFLEVYKPEMKERARQDEDFSASLDLGKRGVGHGYLRDGSAVSGITTVTFHFQFYQGKWRERSGYPAVEPLETIAHLLLR